MLTSTVNQSAIKVRRSQKFFNRMTLPFYDLLLYGWVSERIWGAPLERLEAHYLRHARANHLEVGVGTGYLLDHVKFPVGQARLALMDLSEACLARTARRLQMHAPEVYVQDLLEPMRTRPAPFDSIALNYVLHCVPGDFGQKLIALKNLAQLLGPQGVLFGTTVLGREAATTPSAKSAMWLANAVGLFNNRQDSEADLKFLLRRHFRVLDFCVVGVVAFFAVTHKSRQNHASIAP